MGKTIASNHSPVAIAVYAHCMATIWQDHFGAGLQTNSTFIFSLQIYVGKSEITVDLLVAIRLNCEMLA